MVDAQVSSSSVEGGEVDVLAVPDLEGGIRRAFLMGSVIGFVASFFILGGIALALGEGVAPALGVALFTAVWGGPGFGGMMGAVIYYTRYLEP